MEEKITTGLRNADILEMSELLNSMILRDFTEAEIKPILDLKIKLDNKAEIVTSYLTEARTRLGVQTSPINNKNTFDVVATGREELGNDANEEDVKKAGTATILKYLAIANDYLNSGSDIYVNMDTALIYKIVSKIDVNVKLLSSLLQWRVPEEKTI